MLGEEQGPVHFLVNVHLQRISEDTAPDAQRVAKAKEQWSQWLNLGGGLA